MLREQPYYAAMEELNLLVAKLTITRPFFADGPLEALLRLLHALTGQDMIFAAHCYHDLLQLLLTSDFRRVSGSLFTDYLLHVLLEQPHAFAASASKGENDLPLRSAMYEELSLLGKLSCLTGEQLAGLCGDRLQELKLKPRQSKDHISLITGAAWSGTDRPPLSSAPAQAAQVAAASLPSSLREQSWLNWSYAPKPFEPLYVCDEAMEEIYHRLLHSENWSDCIDDLWNFFATYGTGAFLKDRVFSFQQGCLLPFAYATLPYQDEFTFYDAQRMEFTRHVVRFMRGEHNGAALITGGPGSGKTTLVLSLVRELPAVRLVMADASSAQELYRINGELLRQPLRFLVYVDGIDLSSQAFSLLRQDIQCGRVGGENILVVMSARDLDDTLFLNHIHLDKPLLKDFILHVQSLLTAKGAILNYDTVQNACIDAANAGTLNYTQAIRIATELSKE